MADEFADDPSGRYRLAAASHGENREVSRDEFWRAESDLHVVARYEASDCDASLVLLSANEELPYGFRWRLEYIRCRAYGVRQGKKSGEVVISGRAKGRTLASRYTRTVRRSSAWVTGTSVGCSRIDDRRGETCVRESGGHRSVLR